MTSFIMCKKSKIIYKHILFDNQGLEDDGHQVCLLDRVVWKLGDQHQVLGLPRGTHRNQETAPGLQLIHKLERHKLSP